MISVSFLSLSKSMSTATDSDQVRHTLLLYLAMCVYVYGIVGGVPCTLVHVANCVSVSVLLCRHQDLNTESHRLQRPSM